MLTDRVVFYTIFESRKVLIYATKTEYLTLISIFIIFICYHVDMYLIYRMKIFKFYKIYLLLFFFTEFIFGILID